MNLPSPLKLVLVGVLLAGSSISDVAAQAQVIYRETFGAPNPPSTDLSTTLFDWQQFSTTGAALTAARINVSAVGRPTDVENVNAGPNSDGTFGAYANGIQFVMPAATNLAITTEFSLNIADYEPNSLTFSWYAGNNNTSSTQQLVVRIGSDWYASTTPLSTSSAITLANFATQAQLQSIVFDPTASSWQLINFNGDYIVGGTPGTGTAVNSTLGALSLGASPISDLTGTITGFGLYSVTNSSNSRFDTFEISGIAVVPEPSVYGLIFAGGLVLFCFGRRLGLRRRAASH